MPDGVDVMTCFPELHYNSEALNTGYVCKGLLVFVELLRYILVRDAVYRVWPDVRRWAPYDVSPQVEICVVVCVKNAKKARNYRSERSQTNALPVSALNKRHTHSISKYTL